jgi:uncharacterized protein YaaR (DUF327 family)
MSVKLLGYGTLNDSRIKKMLTANSKEEATKMGRFDRFFDLFRSVTGEKKRARLEQLYAQLTAPALEELADSGSTQTIQYPLNKLKNFVKIASLADQVHHAKFKVEIKESSKFQDNLLVFKIDNETIYTVGLSINSADDKTIEFVKKLITKYSISDLIVSKYSISDLIVLELSMRDLLALESSIFIPNQSAILKSFYSESGNAKYNLEKSALEINNDILRLQAFKIRDKQLIEAAHNRFKNKGADILDLQYIFAAFQGIYTHHSMAILSLFPQIPSEDSRIPGDEPIEWPLITYGNNRNQQIKSVDEEGNFKVFTVHNARLRDRDHGLPIKIYYTDHFKLNLDPENKNECGIELLESKVDYDLGLKVDDVEVKETGSPNKLSIYHASLHSGAHNFLPYYV